MTPAIADCRYREPLLPRLRGLIIILLDADCCQVKQKFLQSKRMDSLILRLDLHIPHRDLPDTVFSKPVSARFDPQMFKGKIG